MGGILYAYSSIVGGFLDPSISLLENGRDIILLNSGRVLRPIHFHSRKWERYYTYSSIV